MYVWWQNELMINFVGYYRYHQTSVPPSISSGYRRCILVDLRPDCQSQRKMEHINGGWCWSTQALWSILGFTWMLYNMIKEISIVVNSYFCIAAICSWYWIIAFMVLVMSSTFFFCCGQCFRWNTIPEIVPHPMRTTIYISGLRPVVHLNNIS